MRSRLIAAGAGLGLLLIGAAAGRYSLPARVVTVKEITHHETVKETTHLTEQVDVQELTKQLAAVAERRNVHTRKTTTREAGKEVVVEETIDTSTTDTLTATDTSSALRIDTDLQLTIDKVTHDTSHERTETTRRASWAISGGVGATFGDWQPVYTASVERRVLGPMWLVGWASSAKAAGVAVRLEL